MIYGSLGVIAKSSLSKGVVHGRTMSDLLAKEFQHHSLQITVSGFCQAFINKLKS